MAFPPPSSTWRPRYWVAGFDWWHLPAVVLCAGLWTALACLPRPTPPPAPKTPAVVVRRLAPTAIQQPLPGTIFRGALPDSAVGVAEPGVIVRLYVGQQFVGQTLSGLDGRFQFHLDGLPRGTNVLRAVAVGAGQASWSGPVPIIIAPAPPAVRSHKKTGLKSKP